MREYGDVACAHVWLSVFGGAAAATATLPSKVVHSSVNDGGSGRGLRRLLLLLRRCGIEEDRPLRFERPSAEGEPTDSQGDGGGDGNETTSD